MFVIWMKLPIGLCYYCISIIIHYNFDIFKILHRLQIVFGRNDTFLALHLLITTSISIGWLVIVSLKYIFKD